MTSSPTRSISSSSRSAGTRMVSARSGLVRVRRTGCGGIGWRADRLARHAARPVRRGAVVRRIDRHRSGLQTASAERGAARAADGRHRAATGSISSSISSRTNRNTCSIAERGWSVRSVTVPAQIAQASGRSPRAAAPRRSAQSPMPCQACAVRRAAAADWSRSPWRPRAAGNGCARRLAVVRPSKLAGSRRGPRSPPPLPSRRCRSPRMSVAGAGARLRRVVDQHAHLVLGGERHGDQLAGRRHLALAHQVEGGLERDG